VGARLLMICAFTAHPALAAIREGIGKLIGDAGYWLEHGTYPPGELAVRVHLRLVLIHRFARSATGATRA
jgi:hypothetical protein